MAEVNNVQLFANRAADGTSSEKIWRYGRAFLLVSGGFDGGSLDIEYTIDGATYYKLASGITSKHNQLYDTPVGADFRAVLSGTAGGNASLNVDLVA